MPTRPLRDEYQNPWLGVDTIIRLFKGVRDDGSRVAVLTYGHYLARVSSGTGPTAGDLIVMDEFGERKPEMGLAWYHTAQPKLMLSATPDDLYCPGAEYVSIPLKREHQSNPPVRLELDPMGLVQEALRDHPGSQRLLVMVPGLAEANRIATGLSSLGRTATVLSSKQRRVPSTGDIVATAIADTGLDIPGMTIVIASGRKVISDRGRVTMATPISRPTSSNEAESVVVGKDGTTPASSPVLARRAWSTQPTPESWARVTPAHGCWKGSGSMILISRGRMAPKTISTRG